MLSANDKRMIKSKSKIFSCTKCGKMKTFVGIDLESTTVKKTVCGVCGGKLAEMVERIIIKI